MTAEQTLQRSDFPAFYARLSSLLETEAEKRAKFHAEVDEQTKAEFINGKIIMHSPAKRIHITVSMRLSYLMHDYVSKYDLGEVLVEKAMVTLTRNSYEPDICYWRKEIAATFQDNDMLFPVPTLIVEILSPSTQKNDRGIKFVDYAAHGVAEYWIIDPKTKTLEQYILSPTGFELHAKISRKGKVKAKAISGFKFKLQDIF